MEKSKQNSSWIGGLVLIATGLIFLWQNLTGWSLGNWWAFFILIPALGAFWAGYNLARQDGFWSRRAVATTWGGAFPLLVALIFLFNMDWGRVWPLFLILAGVGIVFFRQGEGKGDQYMKR
ncbi:hypothetical protein [Allomeiothermus silvanus]|uniref:hypothetical protein n=1 Tax=Allomeiothermus silvanus TaxID=52022 RepID=UPI0023F164B6|nr:hypothetical protein [Allomeiothermus silvanus]